MRRIAVSQSISQIKENKRNLFRTKWKQIKEVASDSIFHRLSDLLSQLDIWQKDLIIASYYPLPGELSPEYFVKKYKKKCCFVFPKIMNESTAVPMKFVTSDQGWEDGPWPGGRQPVGNKEVPLDKISVFLVPALAFDRAGRRLGRGGGYYDRILSQISSIKIGLAWDYQISNEALPEESHDIRMDAVITDHFLLIPLKHTQFFEGVH